MEIQSLKQSHISMLGFSVSQEQKKLYAQRAQMIQELAKVDQQINENKALLDELGFGEIAIPRAIVSRPVEEPKIPLSELPFSGSSNGKSYSPNMNYWEKVKYILSHEGKCLSAPEIIDAVFRFEPELNQGSDDKKQNVKNNLFATLTNKRKNGELKHYKQEKMYRYGFKGWFDKDDQILKEYAHE